MLAPLATYMPWSLRTGAPGGSATARPVIGCEACHGPGSKHVNWSKLPEMGRPEVENYALTVKTRGLTSRRQIELCAPCHARRMSLDDNIHRHADFLDYGIPQLLNEGLYFADGQILDEVYVYGSFMQSKMHARYKIHVLHAIVSCEHTHSGSLTIFGLRPSPTPIRYFPPPQPEASAFSKEIYP